MKLLVLVLVLVVGASARSSANGLQDRKESQFPIIKCPKAEDIKPCVCDDNVIYDEYLDLDCSRVTSEKQLMSVFQANFPYKTFRRFKMYQNKLVQNIGNGTFGSVSFREIWMAEGLLEKIEVGAFDGSAAIAERLIFNMNSISEFPFSDLNIFKQLYSLDLSINKLQIFPRLISPALQVLDLSQKPLGGPSAHAFTSLKNADELNLSNIGMKEILPGTFAGMHFFAKLDLGGNQTTELATNAIQCNVFSHLVDLSSNQIRTVHPGAITGLKKGKLYIQHNFITNLEEKTWKIFVSDGAYLNVFDNPLLCGCDIAWLVRDSNLMHAVDERATCADGRRLWDLKRADYAHC